MALGGRLGGHLVQGHVDGVARVLGGSGGAFCPRCMEAGARAGYELRIELPPQLQRYVVEKGSIAVDGVSLTVAGVGPGWFAVALVPHTLKVTTLGDRRPGDPVQLEVDVVAKYVERLVALGRWCPVTAFAGVEDAVAAMAAGGMVVVVDDADRENEGDLIMTAEAATTEQGSSSATPPGSSAPRCWANGSTSSTCP